MKVKSGDYVINDNGDVWFVETAHKDGLATITFLEGGTGDDTLTYSAGEMDSFFRKLPPGDYSDVSYLDPKPYWSPVSRGLSKSPKSTKRRSTRSVLVGMQGIGR